MPTSSTVARKLKKAVSRSETPLSESSEKFHESWTAEDCVQELRRIAELDLDRVVTRNYFRINSKISESTWNRYFGTFHEFKRQAGIVLTRQQHGLERDIAKHASVDHYRKMSAERLEWGDKYVRPNTKRFKTAIFCSDLHDIEIDPFYLRVFLDVIKRCQPDLVCYVGDVFDLPEFGKYTVDPREWDVNKRIKYVHEEIFGPVRAISPNSQQDFIEGNHEARLLRMLADASPALRVLLADLHGMTVPKLLGLDKFEINYVAKGDLAAYTKRDFNNELRNNYRIYWECLLAHHFPEGRHLGMPGVNGHHHKHIVWPMFNPMFKAYEWHQLGSGHRRDASYTNGEKWHMGFCIANVDTQTKATVFDYIQVSDHAVAGGKWYRRAEAEVCAPGQSYAKPGE